MKCNDPTHEGNEVVYVCCTSEWHTVPLCVQCIPGHTESHQKNRSQANIQLLSKIFDSCKEKLNQSMHAVEVQLTSTQATIEECVKEDENVKLFADAKEEILKKINLIFEELESEYKKYIKDFQKWKISSLEASEKRLRSQRDEIQDLIYMSDLQDEALKIIKFSHLKDFAKELASVREGIDATLKKKLDFDVIKNDGKMAEAIRLIKTSFIVKASKHNEDVLEETKSKLKEERDKQRLLLQEAERSKVPNKEKCPTCGKKMTYVSDFKKHMTCAECHAIKRLYNNGKKG